MCLSVDDVAKERIRDLADKSIEISQSRGNEKKDQ